MIDPYTTVRAFLAGKSALTTLTGSRLYAGQDVPPPGYNPDDGQAITFRVRGGTRDYDDAILIPSMQFKCYGDTETTAYQCYRALVDALHNGHNVTINHAEEETFGQSLEEPDTEWHFVLCFFTIMLRAS